MAVTRPRPVGPNLAFEPWTDWILPDLHGFGRILPPTRVSGFVPILFLLLLTQSANQRNPHGSGIFVQPSLSGAHFRPVFAGKVSHPVVTLRLPHNLLGTTSQGCLSRPVHLMGEELFEATMLKNPRQEVWMAVPGTKVRPFLCLGLLEWPEFFAISRLFVACPQSLLDA